MLLILYSYQEKQEDNMDSFTFCSPTKFVFGKGTENEAGKLIKSFGGTKVLIHYGGRNGTISGFVTLNEDDCTKIYKAMI